MLFKLIIQRYKFPQDIIHNPQPTGEGPVLPDYYTQTLRKIYHENKIYTIGYWQDVDDPYVEYVLNVYRDEEHYNEFIKKMAESDFYKDISQNDGKIRIENLSAQIFELFATLKLDTLFTLSRA